MEKTESKNGKMTENRDKKEKESKQVEELKTIERENPGGKSSGPEIYFPTLRTTLPTLRQGAGIDPNRFKEQACSQGQSSDLSLTHSHTSSHTFESIEPAFVPKACTLVHLTSLLHTYTHTEAPLTST